MGILLTPEERIQVLIDIGSDNCDDVIDEALCKAQVIKLLNELGKLCTNDYHLSTFADKRRECIDCMKEIRKEVDI